MPKRSARTTATANRVLRIRDTVEESGIHVVSGSLRQGDNTLWEGSSRFLSTMSSRDVEDIRWFLEDFPNAPFDPAPTRARRIASRIEEIGAHVFNSFAPPTEPDLRRELTERIHDLRIEVSSLNHSALIWDIMRDPDTKVVPALQSRAFVRSLDSTAVADATPSVKKKRTASDQIRVLVIISRPRAGADIPYQSVAQPLLRALNEHPSFDVHVLRPATLDALNATLKEAHAKDRPFSIVHFDGHGLVDVGRGYLVFENPAEEGGSVVPGDAFGRALADAGTRVAILNACRSADDSIEGTGLGLMPRTRPFAEECLNAGLNGIVAMQYNLFVDTAARFVPAVYGGLANGLSLAEAVTVARRAIHDDPGTRIGEDDWIVPVVYETTTSSPLDLSPHRPEVSAPKALSDVPKFVGRDATLLAIDRLFDVRSIVLLHGMLGVGKTATAQAFCDWYKQTGGAATSEFHRLDTDSLLDIERRLKSGAPVADLWVIDGLEAANEPQLRAQLSSLLAQLVQLGSRVILTSRNQADWLGQNVVRVRLGEMSTAESARVLGDALSRAGLALVADDWRPIFEFANGNPRVLIALAELAARQSATDARAVEDLLFKIGLGELDAADPLLADWQQTASSLPLEPLDWQCLSLARLYRWFADAKHISDQLQRERYKDREELQSIANADMVSVFQRAAAAGLMIQAHDTYYQIHPFLSVLVTEALRASGEQPVPINVVEETYVDLMSSVGVSALNEFESGNQRTQSLKWMRSEEGNLLHAWQTAMRNGWLNLAAMPIAGLDDLYRHQGRTREWSDLVDRTNAVVTGPDGGPLPDCEDSWFRVTLFRCIEAQGRRDLTLAEQLAQRLLQHAEKDEAGNRTLVARTRLADIQRLSGNPDCVEQYIQALKGYEELGSVQDQAVVFFNLGLSYQEVPAIRNLGHASECYKKSFELHQRQDGIGQAICISQMAQIALESAEDLESNGGDPQAIERNIEYAMTATQAALQAPLPAADRGIMFARLSRIARRRNQFDEAFALDTSALECYSAAGDAPRQAASRLDLAYDLRVASLDDALVYARSASDSFRALGPASARGYGIAEQLCRELEAQLAKA